MVFKLQAGAWGHSVMPTSAILHAHGNQQIHVIADNFSAPKTEPVAAFLSKNPKVQIHYTPTYSSWLNQVEKMFADDFARSTEMHTADLDKKSFWFKLATRLARLTSPAQ